MSRSHLFTIGFAAIVACNLVIDFDDIERLPCPCDNEHVCAATSKQCLRKRSVDTYKSCDQNIDPTSSTDDQCDEGARCLAINGDGPKCLPPCTPTTYATPEAGARVASECTEPGKTCFPLDDSTGACADGQCTELPSNCPGIGERCVSFNGAGVCFVECTDVFRSDACAGDGVCHPIGDSDVIACVSAGERGLGDICSDRDLCRKVDGDNRPMMCGKPRKVGLDQQYRCRAICNAGDNSRCTSDEVCVETTGPDLGICFR